METGQFIKTTVILPVRDLYEATAWYEQTLGLQTDYIHGHGKRGECEDFANYAILTRDAVEVHLVLDEGGPVWTRAGTGHLAVTVADIDALYAQLAARKTPITRALRKENWPARGFILTDPSGNEIHITQPI